MTSLAPFPEPRPSPAGAVVWLQCGLLAALASGHLVLPALFLRGQGDLLRDSVLHGQLSLFVLALVWGGLRWWGQVALVLSGAALLAVWHWVIPEDYWAFAYQTVGWPNLGLLAVVVGLRCLRIRGVWSNLEKPAPPFQVSIGQLLAITTLAATVIAGANWARQIPAEWFGDNFTNYSLVTLLDCLGVTSLSLLTVWAVGVRGGTWLKLITLGGAAVLVGACQVIAFRMDDLWLYLALSSAAWLVTVVGSLGVCRVCGWHVVRA